MYRFDENGVANNYADLPKVYVASYPAPQEQQDYLWQGGVALLFVTSLLLTAFGVS